jgi:hypothetical protein
VTIVNRYVRTIGHARILTLRYRCVLAVVHANNDPPRRAATSAIVVLTYLIAYNPATDGAYHGCRRAPVTLADGATQHTAGHRANHRTECAAIAATAALYIDLIHLLHDAAVLAARCVSLSLLIAAVLWRGTAGDRNVFLSMSFS